MKNKFQRSIYFYSKGIKDKYVSVCILCVAYDQLYLNSAKT